MKKRRLLSIVLSLCMVLALMPQMVFAETSGETADGFSYTISDAGEVTITGYTGSATEITIPDTIDDKPVRIIGDLAFQGCNALTSISIPNGVTFIGIYAFYGCSGLESITIPDKVTSIGQGAFLGCSSLTSISIPNSVTSIGQGAFLGCSSLTSISIPNSVTSIGNETFRHCGSLKSITIPDSVTSIGDCAFDGCETLASISIPNSVTSIGNETFTYCGSLKSITIPDSVTSIGEETFKYCNELESISISDRVTSIGKETFYCCKKLTSVNIPNGVTSIGDRAFYTCESLTSISIPDSVTSIGDKSFYNCTSLESIFLPEDLIVTKASIPDTATQVRYSIENGEVTIAGITLGTGKTSVAIPATICGYPVVAVANNELLENISSHTCVGGEATCQTKAICGICKQEYGEKNPDNHTGTKVWEQNETQHKQYWDCCNAVVVDYENHTWNNGVCSVCDYVCKHTGGEATCTSKAICEYCSEEYGELDSSNHSLDKIPAKDATVTETGNIEYWQCENCKKYFADEKGEKEISLEDTVIQKRTPEIIEGMDQSVTEGEKKALSFTSNAAYSDFIRVGLDGSELSEENYEKAEGSIIITLDADYVATLPAGEHTIGIVSESGTAETTFTVEEKAAPGTSDDSDKDSKADAEDSAKTGDDTNLALWLALMLLSGAGITSTAVYTRRKRTNV